MAYNNGTPNAYAAAALRFLVKIGFVKDRSLVDDAEANNWTQYSDNAAGTGKIPYFIGADGTNVARLANPNGTTAVALGVTQLATPSAPTVTPNGTTGATSYSYTVVAKSGTGATLGTSPASAAGSTSTGNATLSATNWNRIAITAVANAASYDVYRTVGGATQGLIGNVATQFNAAGSVQNTVTSAAGVSVTSAAGVLLFDDTGLTADGTTAPTTNTTGVVQGPLDTDINVMTLSVPVNVVVTPKGTVGVTSYSYVVAAVGNVGMAPSSAASTSTGNASLSSTNFNQVTWNPVPGASSYNIYRSVGGATQGLVGQVAATVLSFNDTGIAAITNVPGYVTPTTNTTGSGVGQGPEMDGANIPTLNNAAGQTLTVAQILNQILDRVGAGAGQTDTTPTAAALVQAFAGAKANTGFYWVFRNRSANSITLAAGTGVTLATGNTNTIASNNARTFYVQFVTVTPGSEAVTIWSVGASAM